MLYINQEKTMFLHALYTFYELVSVPSCSDYVVTK